MGKQEVTGVRLADATGLLPASPVEPVPVSPLRAAIPSAVMRQLSPALDIALAEAVRMFRAKAREYQNPRNGSNLDKTVRKALAAYHNDWALTLEIHAQAIEARRAETGTGSVRESAGPKDCAQGDPA